MTDETVDQSQKAHLCPRWGVNDHVGAWPSGPCVAWFANHDDAMSWAMHNNYPAVWDLEEGVRAWPPAGVVESSSEVVIRLDCAADPEDIKRLAEEAVATALDLNARLLGR